MHSLQVTQDITWVGALDPNLRIFDIIMETKYGTTYNSYIVKGTEKIALFETVKEGFFEEWLAKIEEVVDPSDIDYIVLDHTEPDHGGSLAFILDHCPNATVVATQAAITFLEEIANRTFPHIVAKDSVSLDLGGKTLQFIMAPFLHWPDSMYTYIPESKVLITCDSFGCHYADERVFNDAIDDPSDLMDAYKYYFDCIMGPFKSFVLSALDKIKDLEISIICPGHGPVLREDLDKFLSLYRQWATTTPRDIPCIVIAYVSAYGYTKTMAEAIAAGASEAGQLDILLYDLTQSAPSEVMKKIDAASGVLFGSPTLVGEALPPILNLLASMNPIIHKGILAGAFGSYGWSGEAVPHIEERLKQLKLKMPVPGLKIRFKPSEAQLSDCRKFGRDFAEAVLK